MLDLYKLTFRAVKSVRQLALYAQKCIVNSSEKCNQIHKPIEQSWFFGFKYVREFNCRRLNLDSVLSLQGIGSSIRISFLKRFSLFIRTELTCIRYLLVINNNQKALRHYQPSEGGIQDKHFSSSRFSASAKEIALCRL